MTTSGPSAAKEAMEFVPVNNVEKGLQSPDFRIRFVPMPLEVPTHPEHFPDVLRSNKGCLGHRAFVLRSFVPPIGPDFENLLAVA